MSTAVEQGCAVWPSKGLTEQGFTVCPRSLGTAIQISPLSDLDQGLVLRLLYHCGALVPSVRFSL